MGSEEGAGVTLGEEVEAFISPHPRRPTLQMKKLRLGEGRRGPKAGPGRCV